MKTGFSFKGVHAYDIDGVAAVSTDDRPIVPDMKETTFSPLNRDGAYDFSAANPAGREYYEERIFQLKIKVKAANIGELQRTLTLLARWLRGSGDLIFDDIPAVKWAARIVETVPYTPEREGQKAELDVKFRVQPFSEMTFDVIDGPVLDSGIPLDSATPLNIGERFDFTDVKGGDIQIRNIGDVPALPIVTIEGTYGMTIICNGKGLEVPANCRIDCERKIVTDLSGTGIMTEIAGDFFELAPGANMLNVIPRSESGSCHITVRYTPKYLYNAYLEETGFR